MNKINLIFVFLALVWSCQSSQKQGESLAILPLKYANRLKIEYDKNSQYLITVNHKSDSLLYKLPQKVKKIACASATHVAMLEKLNADSCLVGFFGVKFLYSPRQKLRYASGCIKELGSITQPDMEAILTLLPDVILISSSPDELPMNWNIIKQAGIPIIFIAEWLENTPLGRSEWLKVMGILVGDLARATETFDSIAANYEQVRSLAKNSNPTKVIVGNGYQGIWYVPAGESYVASFLRDAGANYPWSHTKGEGSLQIDFETFYAKGKDISIWLNVGSCNSLAELRAYDTRLADFKAIQNKKVFNNNKRTNTDGINQYYETSVVEPDKVLLDIIRILQDSTNNLYYYQPLL